ncbi:hypothetical protein BC834DRAFT_975126 [Gloeopeniophorella convolvens]|nr:hypothetical protein BC834DRAFT_975126 [Gloeopeniophorella convolvens]
MFFANALFSTNLISTGDSDGPHPRLESANSVAASNTPSRKQATPASTKRARALSAVDAMRGSPAGPASSRYPGTPSKTPIHLDLRAMDHQRRLDRLSAQPSLPNTSPVQQRSLTREDRVPQGSFASTPLSKRPRLLPPPTQAAASSSRAKAERLPSPQLSAPFFLPETPIQAPLSLSPIVQTPASLASRSRNASSPRLPWGLPQPRFSPRADSPPPFNEDDLNYQDDVGHQSPAIDADQLRDPSPPPDYRPPTPQPQPEEDELDVGFDPLAPDVDMLADDPVHEDDLILAANGGAANVLGSQEEYESLARTTYYLSQLEIMCNRSDASGARRMLAKKVKLRVDQRYMPALGTPQTASGIDGHFLDFVMYVPNERGCRAILPIQPEARWTFFLKLKDTTRAFKNKHGTVGFPLEGRVMFVGTSGTILNVLLLLAPPSFFEPPPLDAEEQRRPRQLEKGSTVPTLHDRLVVLAFLSHALSEIHFSDIYCDETYPDISSMRTLGDSTNIFQSSAHELLPTAVDRLDRFIKRSWDSWIELAPPSYRSGQVIQDAQLIFVTYRYGQNHPIGEPENREVEAAQWATDVNMARIRYVSVALATHFICQGAASWDELRSDDIAARHGDVFLDPHQQQPVDNLQGLAQLEPDGIPIHIYNRRGVEVPRRTPRVFPGSSACGLLVNLPEMLPYFSRDATLESVRDRLKYTVSSGEPGLPTVYPLAFTGSYGQLQAAGGGIAPFQHALDHLNVRLAEAGEGQVLPGPVTGDGTVAASVELLAVQMYSQITHRVRASASRHAVQQGRLTKAAAGYFAFNPQDKHKADACLDDARRFPHKQFATQLLEMPPQDIPRCLRVENVFCIKVEDLPQINRNGRYIYEQVVCELLDTWELAAVWHPLRSGMVAFLPEVFPHMIAWASYPITSLIETIFGRTQAFRAAHPTLQANSNPNFYDIELLAMLERALNFCHTGSPKVLTRTSMNHLWLSLGITTTGFPSLNPTVAAGIQQMSYFDWPLDLRTRMPLTASSRSIAYTYGRVFDVVYRTLFACKHATVVAAHRASIPGDRNHRPRQAQSLDSMRVSCLDVLMKLYVTETSQFIADGLIADASAILARPNISRPAREYQTERLGWIKLWRSCDSPFSSANDATSLLIRCFLTSPADARSALPRGALSSFTRDDFASSIFNKAMGKRPRDVGQKAPIIPGGSFHRAFRVLLTFSLFPSLDLSDPGSVDSTCEAFIPLFKRALDRASISVIPTFATHDDGSISYKAFILLSASPPAYNHIATPISLPIAQMTQPQLQQAHVDSRLWPPPHHPSTPTDIDPRDLKALGMHQFEANFFDWIHASWDMSLLPHRLALILGIALAEAMPKLTIPMSFTHNAPDPKAAEFTEWFHCLPWQKTSIKKGITDRSRYVTLIVCWIIAVYDPNSPIYKCKSPSDGTRFYSGFEGELTRKFSNKSIKPSLFAHIGAVKPLSTGIFQKPLFNKTWAPLDQSELAEYWSHIFRDLSCGQYGAHRLFRSLFGETLAESIACRLNLARATDEV